MEFFRDTHFEFMKYRKVFVALSALSVLVGVLAVFVHGKLNIGIDFIGGTQLTLKFEEQPEVETLRELLSDAGVADSQIVRFGDKEDHEVLIKTPLVEGTEEGSRDLVIGALRSHFDPQAGEDSADLNRIGVDSIASLLVEADPDGVRGQGAEAARAHYDAVAEAVSAVRTDHGIISSWDEITSLEGVSEGAFASLQSNAYLGKFSVLSAENVGPQIGKELRMKGVRAVAFSLLGMLLYIWFRFELRFGIGALIALVHDVLITLGLFAILDYEFNLTTIAAFLTLVGYSVNDSVVVFDRVRENLRRARKQPLVEVLDLSINQTLSRTVLTSGTTLLAVSTLFFFGGDVIHGFSFVLLVGVIDRKSVV